MKFFNRFLLAPGPTPLPEEVRLEAVKDIYHHKHPKAKKVFQKVTEDLKWLIGTKHNVYQLASSGTGAMEAAMQNLVNPGDKVIVINAGNFGGRWSKLAKAFGANLVEIKKEWGDMASAEELEGVLKQNPDTVAVFCQLSETSTGTCCDAEGFAKVVSKTNAILVVDAVSGLGVVPLKMDEWGVDCVAAGSQKGLMLPPGLGLIAMNDKAWKLVEANKQNKFYFDLRLFQKKLEKWDTPWTPPIGIIMQADKAMELVKEEGLENLWARSTKLADGLRAAIKALGLELFSKYPGDAVTTVKVPEGFVTKQITAPFRDKYNITIAGGQGDYEEKMFRFGTMGCMDMYTELAGVAALEMVLKDLGWKFTPGAGVSAFMAEMMK